jgi:hypothetical protein
VVVLGGEAAPAPPLAVGNGWGREWGG